MVEFFTVVIVILGALGVLYWRWSRRIEAEIDEGAAIEWARFRETDPEFLKGYDEARFRGVYRKIHFPRFPGYALACIVSFGLALPVIFALLAASQWAGAQLGFFPQPAEIANRYLIEGDQMKIVTAAPSEAALYYVEDLAGFYYFFGMLLSWLVIVAFFMRRYHKRRPGYLRDELIRWR